METSNEILRILDSCCDSYTFPMLDNGYVYPAASRLSLFRSPDDWAMVIELFGFSPRAGLPDLNVSTFASTLTDRDPTDAPSRRAAGVGRRTLRKPRRCIARSGMGARVVEGNR